MAPKGVTVQLFPVHLLFLLVLMNRYLLGPVLRRVRGNNFDPTDDSFEPTVAIVIPMFNEGRGIYDTILSLLEQDYPPEKLEVVVVDDTSTDDSYAWAKRAADGRRNVAVLRNPANLGKRRSINRAVRITAAEIVVSVDSDVVLDRRAVRELVRRFVSPNIGAVGGRTFVANQGQSWLTRMIEVKFFFSQEWLKDIERSCGSVMCCTGCLTAYRRHVLLELEPVLERRAIAGVPIRYGEDRYLTHQILNAGYRTVFTLDAFCFTAAPPTLAGYFSQQVRWRRSNLVDFFLALTHPWRLHPIVGIHYMSYLGLLIVYPVVIAQGVMNGNFIDIMALHLGFVAALGVVYRFETRAMPDARRVPAFSFLPMALVMPVTYLLLTPLALFTLDSGNWETRKPAGHWNGEGSGPEAVAGTEQQAV